MELSWTTDLEAGHVKSSIVELQSNDGENDDQKEYQQSDLREWSDGFENGLENHLET